MSLREEITAAQDVVEAYKCALCKDTGMTFDKAGDNRVASTCACRRAEAEHAPRGPAGPLQGRLTGPITKTKNVSMAAVQGHFAAMRFVEEVASGRFPQPPVHQQRWALAKPT